VDTGVGGRALRHNVCWASPLLLRCVGNSSIACLLAVMLWLRWY
jgi:hypothetical protein